MTVEPVPAIDLALARRLVDTQFPRWAELPLLPYSPAGSDHVIYRLGGELSVRLPRHAGAIKQARKEAEWLARLAPRLPLSIPVLVEVGEPDLGYPWPWAVSRWLDGEVATVDALSGSHEAARALAGFLTALHRFDAEPPGDLSGEPLAERDTATRSAIAKVGDAFDAAAMTELWDAALAAPAWDRAPAWFHGDFHTGNLLTTGGRLSAVIDFGELGAGDPARDLIIAFTLMSAETRATFRAALDVDDPTWTRGRGWALATGLNAHTCYAAVNPRVAAQTTRQINHALAG
ncbi:Predicted kinase, aminoglycoside phosphotransferase (APT) family [Amycolatopsis xylanica]|uniref:Predicted kinase, aminoglycoside phosphotransferase (APT) family n=1 Tax=Amycolatopsis xylanica TaxID=589385 RepID=A0A1H2U6D5_9PSEU|nr:aminoglycoside phosphotransferase family protein [Amycolatopsis xylanica]SDW51139.1 Predicted kinase, aminoglycoside phosphotransferase (APT) family [Amycolatopsis xylanica]